jgi:uncharacterized membrane protein
MARAGRQGHAGSLDAVRLAMLVLAAGAGAWVAARLAGPRNGHALGNGREVDAEHGGKHRPDMPTLAGGRGFRVERTMTISRTPDELYRVWRNFEHLRELMPHLQSVTELDEKRSHWVARGPAGVTVEWDAELVADEPGRLIAWRSIAGSDVDNAGSVRFTPASGDRGTEVKVRLSYAPPAGRLGDVVATIFGRGADRQIREDLRRFKQRMEAREVALAVPPTAPAWSH